MKLIYNDERDIPLFRKMFGPAWEAAAELDSSLGAFVMLDSEQRMVMDENAARCLGLPNDVPNYARLKELLTFATNKNADFEVKFLGGEGSVTAGFLRKKTLTEQDPLHFRLCSRNELAQAAVQDPDAIIMMLSVEGADEDDEDYDSCVFSAVEAIFGALPAGSWMARVSDTEFRLCLPGTLDNPEAFAEELCKRVRGCTVHNRLGTPIREKQVLSLCVGICVGRMASAYKMHAASFALYEAKSGKGGSIRMFYPEKYEERKEEYTSLMKFSRLIRDNLFIYHFQPIVSAHDGEIVAYEALMRSDPTIGYGPLDILHFAEKRGMLYDIELATLRNTLTALSENQNFFDERKLFINSIPSQVLTEADFSSLLADFGELTEKTVIEMTEHTQLTDEMLAFIKKRLSGAKMQLAIDDYGTGYSNTSNLLRYSPDYLKLDRSLIADIDRDLKKQALVAGVIEFVHANGCMALAEGVETLEEVRTVIRLSVDLLQGYYISRPKPVLLSEISEGVREEIIKINQELSGTIRKVYRAADGETLELNALALDKYTDIFIEGGKLTLEGAPEKSLRLSISIREGSESEITLHNVRIESDQVTPLLTLSKNSKVRLICDGDNVFNYGGIYVPYSSMLRISGSGRLSVTAETTYCFGIGSIAFEPFGEILIDMDGTLSVSSNGEKAVGIGGGKNGKITAHSGALEINCTGTDAIAIGSFEGDVPVVLHDCGIQIGVLAVGVVGIGAMRGKSDVDLQNLALEIKCSGASICGIGTLHEGGSAQLNLMNMTYKTEMNGRNIINAGTQGGEIQCQIANAELTFNCEGGSVTGVGDPEGGGDVHLRNSNLLGSFRTGHSRMLGSPNGSYNLDNSANYIKLNA